MYITIINDFVTQIKGEISKWGDKMERYLSRSPQAGWLDAVGLRLGILAGCEVWFFALWGVGLPAILAGGALAAMIFLALRLLKKRRVVRKEQALRRRIGGELALEELLLAPAKKAHFQVALLVSAKWPVVLLRVTEDGMLCRYGTETLLVSCLALPPEESAEPAHLLSVQRACRRHRADRGVVCLTCKCSAAAKKYAEDNLFPLRLMEREELLALAGQAWPATDEQLVALGKRKKKGFPLAALLERMLRREKARRYVLYGTGLVLMGLSIGGWWYFTPGAACILLGILCRYLPRRTETL